MSGIAADVREVEAREETEAAEAAAERAERDAFEQRCVLSCRPAPCSTSCVGGCECIWEMQLSSSACKCIACPLCLQQAHAALKEAASGRTVAAFCDVRGHRGCLATLLTMADLMPGVALGRVAM